MSSTYLNASGVSYCSIPPSRKTISIHGTNDILILSFFTGDFKGDFSNMLSFAYIFEALIYTFISVILYINFCWKLFARIDKLLDKRLGSDEEYQAKRKAAEAKRLAAKTRRKNARKKKS